LEADGVVAVEEMGDLLRGPAQPLSQLRRVEPGIARRAVKFELGDCQKGSRTTGRPLAGEGPGTSSLLAIIPRTASSSMSSACRNASSHVAP
jgi:hypothetical protein